MNGVRGSKRVNPINNLKVYSYVSMESRDKSSKGTPTTSGNSKADKPLKILAKMSYSKGSPNAIPQSHQAN